MQIAEKIRKKLGLYNRVESQTLSHMLQYISERPLDINIETTSVCPLRCAFCCNRLYERKREVMSMALFKHIVEEYCEWGGGTLSIGAMQSDFMSDPLLEERLGILKKNKHHLFVYSTTPLLTASRLSDRILLEILQVFDHIEISVPGHDAESYIQMSGINGFKTFEEQLNRLHSLVKEYDLKTDITLLFRTYSRKKLLQSSFFQKSSKLFRVADIKTEFFSWFGSVKQEDVPLGAKVVLQDNKGKREDCVAPNATMAISVNGKVLGCGCVDWLGKFVIGDVNNDSLQNIWRSERAIHFRHLFSNGDSLPQICRECALYSPISVLSDCAFEDYTSMKGVWYWLLQSKCE